jgi:putative spermidine/putrescine transport system permease protein
VEAGVATPRRSAGRRLAGLFHGRPRLQVGALLSGPIAWLVIGYLGSLVILLITGFWSIGERSQELEQTFTLDNFGTLFSEPTNRAIVARTVGIAAAVTVVDALLAFPIAFFMAKVASPRVRGALVVAVLMPLWSGYLVKVYVWRTIMSGGGLLGSLGIAPTDDVVRICIVLAYLWLPFMIIPIYAGLERIPNSLLSASEDLGAKPPHTFRKVILPLAFPALVAGSIFTFSLSLGDIYTPYLVSKTNMIGNYIWGIYQTNLPLAAVFSLVPIVVMIVYLVIARRLGAFEHI